jgi:hypothetical protein
MLGPTSSPVVETLTEWAQAIAFCMSSGRLSGKYSI